MESEITFRIFRERIDERIVSSKSETLIPLLARIALYCSTPTNAPRFWRLGMVSTARRTSSGDTDSPSLRAAYSMTRLLMSMSRAWRSSPRLFIIFGSRGFLPPAPY